MHERDGEHAAVEAHRTEELAEDSIAQEREEVFIAEMVQQGHSVDGLYPLNAEWRARYEEWEAGKAND